MTQPHRQFAFQTEFTPDGEVLSGPARSYYSRDEAEKLATAARSEGEARARAAGFASVDRILAHLAPVSAQLAQLADTLRREAAELALISARKIAGEALDKAGEQAAAEAVASVIGLLKANPVVTVSVAPESLAEMKARLEQIQRQGRHAAITFIADPKAKPGDWRVEWAEGAAGFSREQVEAAIESLINARLEDPVEPQLELFTAA
jgi:flagellar assembly protein FliH